MLDLLGSVGSELLSNILQIIVGVIVSLPLYFWGASKTIGIKHNVNPKLPVIALFVLLGMLLPLGTYGIIPLVFVFSFLGFTESAIIPMLISNSIYNMLLPILDISFVWKTGYTRIIFAFIAGIFAGIILDKIKTHSNKSIALHIPKIFPISGSLSVLNVVISNLCFFLIIGVFTNNIFHRFILNNFINEIYRNPATSAVPHFFAGFNVMNPLFMLSFQIALILSNLTNLSGIYALTKWKGLIFYIGYLFIWALLFGLSILFL